MADHTDKPELSAEDAANADYLARRRDLMTKLAAGAMATPLVLSSVTSRAGAVSFPSPPPE